MWDQCDCLIRAANLAAFSAPLIPRSQVKGKSLTNKWFLLEINFMDLVENSTMYNIIIFGKATSLEFSIEPMMFKNLTFLVRNDSKRCSVVQESRANSEFNQQQYKEFCHNVFLS